MSKSQAPNKEISGQIEKSELLERLKAWAGFLSEIDQEEDKSELNQICASLVSPDLLEYQDADVKLFVACCAADVLRIYAPEAPYADEQLKEIFMMFVEQLRGLEDIEGKSFKRYFYLLENLACVKTFILCMELDAPDIILSLFRTFFQIFNDRHVGKVQTFMVDIMMTVMQEGDSIPQDVMDIILMHVIQPYKSRKPAAHRLAKELINKSATYMEPNIQKFFNAALMKGLETDSGLHSRVYDLIKELNRVCPSILLAVLPQLQEKLKSSDVNERLEVTRLLAEMFSDKGSELASQNKQLWNCFLRRFNDIEAAVRAECVSTCKNFILNHLKLSDDCYSNLCKRHRDPDEKVRLEAVKVVYAIASEDITRMTPELFMILQERMLDKKWPIRHQAIMNVARLYKEMNSKKDATKIKQVAWMPNKVLHTYYQNTSQDRLLVERLLLSCLVPVSLGSKDRMNILLRTYCLLDAAAIKALNELLKYQQTIRMHLAALLKAIEQGIGEEDRKKLLNQVSMLSKSLPDSKTANSDLKRLSNTLVHDRQLLKAFQTIVTPGVSCQQVARAVGEIMKKLTNKNPIMDTIRALMDRTAPVLADASCITVLVNLTSSLLTAPTEAESDDEDKFNIFINGQKGLHLILSLATVYPGQFKAEEVFEQLLVNLKNPDSEVVLMDLKILAKTAHGLDKRHPTVASCLQPQLLKIAKEGTPNQAKQAIQVIHTVYTDSPKVLEHLLESMVEMLDPELPNLPSIVKAMGQIAKVAPKIFEGFSREIVRDFIVSEVLTQDREDQGEVEDDYWCEEDELSRHTRVKMEGLHVMVNWVSQTSGDKTVISTPVLKLLWALLQQKGDMNGNCELRLCSMSHLRLHAGLCVLKLASEPSCFDLIPLELFQEVAWLIQDPCVQVKQAMLTKLQKGLTSMKLPLEYVALLAFYATDVGKERRSKARQILLRVIQLRREYMIMNSSNSERNHTVLPEYALPTLIHLLAYHPNMDIASADALKSSLDVLWWFLEPLMQKNDNFPFLKKLVETVKQAVDAIDPFNDVINERMYAVCDLAFGVINCKCSNVKLPPFPGEVKLSKKFFAPPEKLVANTKRYIPDKFDFNPHRVPVAVEMEVDHPTVKKRLVVAAETPLKKKSRRKFARKKKISSESEKEEEEEPAADNWLDEIAEKEDKAAEEEEDVEMKEAEEEEEEAEDHTPEVEDEPELSDIEDTTTITVESPKPKKKKVKEPKAVKPSVQYKSKKPPTPVKKPELKAKKPKLVVKKQPVPRIELFSEPELPKPRVTKGDDKPQKIVKVKISKQGHSRETIKKSFNSMYDQLIKNLYSPMPYHRQKSPSPERVVKLPEKRLTLVSTRHQKKIGLDKVDLGQSPAAMVSSTPVSDIVPKSKRKKNDIRSFLEPSVSTPISKKVKSVIPVRLVTEEEEPSSSTEDDEQPLIDEEMSEETEEEFEEEVVTEEEEKPKKKKKAIVKTLKLVQNAKRAALAEPTDSGHVDSQPSSAENPSEEDKSVEEESVALAEEPVALPDEEEEEDLPAADVEPSSQEDPSQEDPSQEDVREEESDKPSEDVTPAEETVETVEEKSPVEEESTVEAESPVEEISTVEEEVVSEVIPTEEPVEEEIVEEETVEEESPEEEEEEIVQTEEEEDIVEEVAAEEQTEGEESAAMEEFETEGSEDEIIEEEEDDDAIPLLPVGDDSDESEEEYVLPSPKKKRGRGRPPKGTVVKKPVAPQNGVKRGRGRPRKNPLPIAPGQADPKTPLQATPKTPKTITEKPSQPSKKKVAPRNPAKPSPPRLIEAMIITEDKEVQPSIIEEEEEDHIQEKQEKENKKQAVVRKRPVSSALKKVEVPRKPVKLATKQQKEELNEAQPQTTGKRPASKVASMEESEPEIKIKRRKTLRRSQ